MHLFKKYYYGDYDSLGKGSSEPAAQDMPSLQHAPNKTLHTTDGANTIPKENVEWPLFEIFIRSKQGLDHKHVGSLHATDAQMAIENARDVYTRRQEGVSIWVVESKHIAASNPDEAESFYEPANDKVYRHPTFYDLPDEINHM